MDPKKKWEECDIPRCKGMKAGKLEILRFKEKEWLLGMLNPTSEKPQPKPQPSSDWPDLASDHTERSSEGTEPASERPELAHEQPKPGLEKPELSPGTHQLSETATGQSQAVLMRSLGKSPLGLSQPISDLSYLLRACLWKGG